MDYASRSSRFLGQFLDAIVTAAPVILASVATLVLGEKGSILFVLALLASAAYYFLADGLEGGQSLGKRMIGMRVIDRDSGEPCTFGQSFVRNLLLAVLGPIDWIFIVGERHQRLGDMAAGTVVVQAP